MEVINMNIIKKTKEHTTKLSMSGKIKKSYRIYCMVVVIATLIFGASVTAFAANDPIAVINNLSGFISCSRSYFAWLWCCSGGTFPEVP